MLQDNENSLQKKKVRPTAMRLLVLETLSGQKTAKSLSDLEKSFEKSDRVTLFRTLKTFQENGLVHSIDDGTGAPKYALCEEGCNCDIEKDLHVHFHCRKCNETFCLPKYKIPEIDLPEDFRPEEANLVVKGICGRLLKFSYQDRVSFSMTTLARNSPISLAIAVTAFPGQPLIALAFIIGPLIELPILVLVSQAFLYSKK